MAAQAGSGGKPERGVHELLQRARREIKEKQRAADRALFGGRGLSRRGVDASDRADSSRECDSWLREATAHLLGVTPSKEFVEHQYRDMAELTGGAPAVKPQVVGCTCTCACACTHRVHATHTPCTCHAHAADHARTAPRALRQTMHTPCTHPCTVRLR